jgi:FkbM family methyltransferase
VTTELDRALATCTKIATQPDLLWYPSAGLFVRHRGDIGNILQQRSYWKGLLDFSYEKEALLLDLGAYIGDSTWYFLSNNLVNRVVAVEANPDNAKVCLANWGDDPRVRLMEGAVVPHNYPTAFMYLAKTYPAAHTLEQIKGRAALKIACINIDELFALHPAVIKCSIEMTEYRLPWRRLPDSVTEVAIFLTQKQDRNIPKGQELDNTLLGMGFRHHGKPPKHEPLFGPGQVGIWTRR